MTSIIESDLSNYIIFAFQPPSSTIILGSAYKIDNVMNKHKSDIL